MRLRLLLSLVLVVAVSIGSVVLLARRSAETEVRNFGRLGMEGLARTLEDYHHRVGSWEGVEALLSPQGPVAGRGRGPGPIGAARQRTLLVDPEGRVLVDTADPSPEAQLTANELDLAIPLYDRETLVGYLVPERLLIFTQDEQAALVGRLNSAAFTAALIAGVISLGVASALAYRLVRPIQELTRAASRLGEGDLDQRVPVRGQDELAVLGRTFNTMAASLQQAEGARRELTADIAHELRTPLAIQRANLEALLDGVLPLRAEDLETILAQNLLLTRLVEDLRTLALADAGQLALERVPTEIGSLAQRMVERFQPQAAAQRISLVAPVSSACPDLLLDPLRLEQILTNLLSNALRHTPEGGRIEVSLVCQTNQVQLAVRDSGPGIPEEALPRVFERFYRADRARSRSEGGTGLGLSIARQLALAHHGDLTAANHPAGGAVFTLTLPVGS